MLSQTGIITLQSAAAATGNGIILNVSGRSSAILQITGTFVGTITYEARMGEEAWVGIVARDMASATDTKALTATAPALVAFDTVAGLNEIRARISAYTSGNITVVGSASD